MRALLLVVCLGASACASSAMRPVSPVALVVYSCGDIAVRRVGNELRFSGVALEHGRNWRDADGNHHVIYSRTPSDGKSIEITVPADPRQDAVISFAGAGSTTKTQVCTASGGYNDILARYLKGDSVDDLTQSFALASRDETRTLLRKAMASLQRRYFRED